MIFFRIIRKSINIFSYELIIEYDVRNNLVQVLLKIKYYIRFEVNKYEKILFISV